MATIILNGRSTAITANILSYNDIVRLAFEQRGKPWSKKVVYTVTYSGAHSHNERAAGSLMPGEFIIIRDGTVIDAAVTNNA